MLKQLLEFRRPFCCLMDKLKRGGGGGGGGEYEYTKMCTTFCCAFASIAVVWSRQQMSNRRFNVSRSFFLLQNRQGRLDVII